MSFVETIKTNSYAIGYYCRFSGIPYIFSNFDKPSGWSTTIDSDSYTWSKTLLTTKGLGSVQQKVELAKGIATSGGIDISFQLPGTSETSSNPWLELLAINAFAKDSDGNIRPNSRMIETINPSDTATDSIELDTYTNWPTTGYLYAGLETIEHNTTASKIVKRGCFGSRSLQHRISFSELLDTSGAGPRVTDHPLVWRGRELHLYAVTGKIIDGQFVPDGADIESSDEREIFSGTVSKFNWSNDLLSVKFNIDSLEGLLGRSILGRFPTAKIGTGTTEPTYWIDENCHRLACSFTEMGSTGTSMSSWSTVNTVSGGLKTVPTINRAFATAVSDAAIIMTGSGNYTLLSVDIGGSERYKLKVVFTAGVAISAISVSLRISCGGSDIFRVLGFEDDIEVVGDWTSQGGGVWYLTFEIEASKDRAEFYLPEGTRKVSRIYYYDGTLDFESTLGFKDADGSTIPSYVKIGEEIIGIDSVGTETINGQELSYLTISSEEYLDGSSSKAARGLFGTETKEHYVEINGQQSKEGIITQGLSFRNAYLYQIILYMLLSGSGEPGTNDTTYDQGWFNCCANIRADLVDIDSIEGLGKGRDVYDNLAVFSTKKFRELIASELILNGYSLVAGYSTSTSKYQIKAVKISPPLGVNLDDTSYTLDLSSTNTKSGVTFETAEEKVINSVIYQTAFDHAQNKWLEIVNAFDSVSVGTYGESSPIKLSSYRYDKTSFSTQTAEEYCDSLFSNYASVFSIVKLNCSDSESWLLEPGDTVNLTLGNLPRVAPGASYLVPGRGIDDIPAVVMSVQKNYPSAQGQTGHRSKITLLLSSVDNIQRSVWSPSARVTGHTGTVLTCAASDFSDNDVEYFKVGEKVTPVIPGETDYYPVKITSIDPVLHTITVTPTLGLSYRQAFYLQFADFDEASLETRQKLFPYFADSSQQLTDSTGAKYPAFKWS